MSALAGPAHEAAPGRDAELRAALGMWVFIASELLFFGGLMLAYLVGRVHEPQGFALASRHTDVVLGTVNTALLLTSSAAVALAVAFSEGHDRRRASAGLLALTAALGLAFLAVKGLEYAHDADQGLFPGRGFALAAPGAELFFVLYLLMTAVHALHLVLGIGGVSVLAWGLAHRRAWALPRRVDAMALYWHFVDVVWIFLYPLLYLVERHR